MGVWGLEFSNWFARKSLPEVTIPRPEGGKHEPHTYFRMCKHREGLEPRTVIGEEKNRRPSERRGTHGQEDSSYRTSRGFAFYSQRDSKLLEGI